MIDKKQDQDEGQSQDEYQFADLDNLEPELGDSDSDTLSADPLTGDAWYTKKENLRYAMIGVGVLVAVIVLYQFVSAMLNSGNVQVKPPVSTSLVKPVKAPMIIPEVQPVQAMSNPSVEFGQKISALEVSQSSVSSDVSNLNHQISTLSSAMNDLNTKIDQLTQAMNVLASQSSAQSQQLAALSTRTKPMVKHVVQASPVRATVYYYIQAVIPGRAWLISANGTTITVREGSSVPGYGVVKLIDPAQGRVVTSSGRIIAFSQQDT